MTGAQLAALIRYKTRTNSTTFTDADMLPLVNMFKDEIASMIVERNAGYFLIPSTFNLVANQREYFLGNDVLNRIKKVELKFDSSSARLPARALKDYLGSETESEIVKNFSNAEGQFAYVIRRRSLLILSGTIASVTDGGRFWAYIYPADLSVLSGSTDLTNDPSTTSFGIPRQFHELWARRVAMEYKSRQPKPIRFSPMENNYYQDLNIQLDAISVNDESEEIIADYPSAQDLWNNGHDL